MVRDRSSAVAGALLALVIAGCEQPPEPIGSLSVEPALIDLGFPRFTPLEVRFEATGALTPDVDPLVMVHLLDDSGAVVRTFDHPLPFDWRAGAAESYAIDLYQSALAPPLEPGRYRLSMGLYHPEHGRWALTAPGEEVGRQEYVVAEVVAGERAPATPKFLFSPAWLATEAGTDVQILGRRWLRGDGEIRITEVPGPGVLRLQLRIPPADELSEDLVLSEGYDTVRLDVATTCSEATWSFEGIGTHVVDLSFDTAVESCEVSFTPHYQIVRRLNLEGRALAVDLIAWRPAGGSPAGG